MAGTGFRIGALALAANLFLAACGDGGNDIVSDLQSCRRLELIDRFGLEPLRGAEDLVIDRQAGRIYVSAFDRFALEDALKTTNTAARETPSSDPRLPRGGIYAIDLADLPQAGDQETEEPARLTVREVTGAFLGDRDFRPHGLDLYDDPLGNRLLAAVVHRYVRDARDRRWIRESGVALYAITPTGLKRLSQNFHPRLCQANDVAIVGPRTLLVTRDHGACNGWAAVEDVLALKRSNVMRLSLDEDGLLDHAPVPVTGGIGFANGIVIDREDRRVIVAATREQALLVYDLDHLVSGSSGRPIGRLALEGGPDNLAMDGDGEVLAAVHPSLLRMGFYRRRWLGVSRAPAKVVAVDLKEAHHRPLYHDRGGRNFPAVTIAARNNDHIVMGSVGAAGLQICMARKPGEEGGSHGE